MFVAKFQVNDRLCQRKKPVWSGGERLSIESREGSNIRGDLTHIRGISIQLPDVSTVISVTHCKFPSLNLKIKAGYWDKHWTNISCQSRFDAKCCHAIFIPRHCVIYRRKIPLMNIRVQTQHIMEMGRTIVIYKILPFDSKCWRLFNFTSYRNIHYFCIISYQNDHAL